MGKIIQDNEATCHTGDNSIMTQKHKLRLIERMILSHLRCRQLLYFAHTLNLTNNLVQAKDIQLFSHQCYYLVLCLILTLSTHKSSAGLIFGIRANCLTASQSD